MSAQSTPRFSENQKVYFVFQNAIMQPADGAEPNSFYVCGHFEHGTFFIDGDVKGEGELASSGRPGWMEMPSGEFYSQETARGVTSPYVNGYMTDNGFVPSSRKVR